MAFQFEHPLWLLLLLPIIYLAYWSWGRFLRLNGWQKIAVFSIRCLTIILLIFVLSGLHWTWTTEQMNVTYVVDRSDSIQDYESIERWLKEAEIGRSTEDTSTLVTFGLDAVIERTAAQNPIERLRMNSRLNPSFTDMGNAIRLASSAWPNEIPGRIVLISDGVENNGSLLREARILQSKGISLDILHTGWEQTADVAIEDLRVPEQMYLGERYGLEVTVQSNVRTGATLRIYEGQREIAQQFVQVEQGENRFLLQTIALNSGIQRYRVEIFPENDDRSINNQAFAYSRVSGPPNVLVVGAPDDSQTLIEVLEANLIPYELQVPAMLSDHLEFYTKYDSILLNNISAADMTTERMTLIEQAVRDFGVGLVAFGGDTSFGLGNYFETPLENALPVYMDLRGEREIPSLAMVLMIDRSGSMSGENIRLARESAARTAELLRPQDTLGVIAFDTHPTWVVEPQEIGENAEAIQEKIRTIDIGGGTDIYPAVEEGFHALKYSEANRKHMILLTDGHSSTQQNYRALIEEMAESGVTLSTVAIGTGADHQLLERLANMANGRYYNAEHEQSLPAIFSLETVMMSRTYIVDEPFIPHLAQAADWHGNLQEGVPPIWAYIATTPKETAEVALMSPETDPLLARWRYGAGKAIAWTSDIAGKWSGEWVSWEQFSEVMGEWIKWSFPAYESTPMRVETRREGTTLRMTAISSDPNFHGTVQAIWQDGDPMAGDSQSVRFHPVEPGIFETELPLIEPGAYVLRMETQSESENDSIQWTTGFTVPYSPEYAIQSNASREQAMSTLETAVEWTGGRMLSWDHPEAVFQDRPEQAVKRTDISYSLLLACLLLWLMDIALRRFSGYRFALRREGREERAETKREQAKKKMITSNRKDPKTFPEKNGSMGAPRDAAADQVSEISQREETMNRLLEAKKRR